jgi:amino acid transporter
MNWRSLKLVKSDRADTGAGVVAAGGESPEAILRGSKAKDKRLGAWTATAICGNDITSSCLYVSSIAIVYAGILAPVALLLAAGVLYLYKKIYTEVVEALPLDGGVYNALLNSTRKFDASLASCLTMLSYLATAVISAKTAAEYLRGLFPVLPPMEVTTLILVAFAVLTIMGITESSRVALAIFLLHLGTLSFFVLWILVSVPLPQMWSHNWHQFGHLDNWAKSLFLGFSAAMLGVTGFESSANYVEHQKPGVFRLTLKNMWIAVTIFNPLIALLALGVLPIPEIVSHQADLISVLGLKVGGHTLHTLIVWDAFLVLSGSVLTSYIGFGGLIHRMTLDQCFPQILLKKTRRNSYPVIVLSFLTLCISILYLTHGELLSLAGVYTISFLGVMTFFAIANILLRVNRRELKRTYNAGWVTVVLGALATMAGIVGNLSIDFRFLEYFAIYFVPAVIGYLFMYFRIPILKMVLTMIDHALGRVSRWRLGVNQQIEAITNVRVVVFVGWGTLPRMFKAFDYLNRNEDCRNILVCRLFTEDNPEDDLRLHRNIGIIRELFPHMTIEYMARKNAFSPETVEGLSKELEIPKNMMFMGSLTHTLDFSLQDLGGVRVIW